LTVTVRGFTILLVRYHHRAGGHTMIITGSELLPGDIIPAHCGILMDVVVKEILKPGFYLLTRADGSEFTTTIPADAPLDAGLNYEARGANAFAAGVDRIVPRDILVECGAHAARAWYQGWDRANLAAEVA
jgi:hypothetical protein